MPKCVSIHRQQDGSGKKRSPPKRQELGCNLFLRQSSEHQSRSKPRYSLAGMVNGSRTNSLTHEVSKPFVEPFEMNWVMISIPQSGKPI
jgi:hypothetical protein